MCKKMFIRIYYYVFTSIKLTVSSAFIQGWYLLFTFSQFVCGTVPEPLATFAGLVGDNWWSHCAPGARWPAQAIRHPSVDSCTPLSEFLVGRPQKVRYKVYINVLILIGTLPSTCTLQMIKSKKNCSWVSLVPWFLLTRFWVVLGEKQYMSMWRPTITTKPTRQRRQPSANVCPKQFHVDSPKRARNAESRGNRAVFEGTHGRKPQSLPTSREHWRVEEYIVTRAISKNPRLRLVNISSRLVTGCCILWVNFKWVCWDDDVPMTSRW